MTYQILNDAWFAGFADGEACFAAYRRPNAKNSRLEYVQPRFMVVLRADDFAILEEIAGTFGGKVRVGMPSGPTVAAGAMPQARWQVANKPSLGRLVTYFDQFPLRAKKARDYAIWRRIVLLYIARGGAADFGEMEALRLALVAVRAYESEAEIPIPQSAPSAPSAPRVPQLRLLDDVA